MASAQKIRDLIAQTTAGSERHFKFDFQNGYHTQAKSGGYAPISYRNRAPCVSPTSPVCHLVCYPGPAPRE